MQMRMAPISVVVPCYRCVDTIQRAVDSIARQTLVPAEVILVDDCSADGTLERLQHLRDLHPPGWIRVLGSGANGGPSVARNAGWNAASQPYVAFLDADDSWHPQKIEVQYGWMRAHPDVALTGHRFSLKRDALQPLAVALPVEATTFSRKALLLSNRFSTPTVMLRRDIVNRFEEEKRHSEDFLLWLDICLGGLPSASLCADLTYLHKAPYGEGGLSSELGAMTLGELDTYRRLYRKGHVTGPEYAFLRCWCVLKYVRRLALRYLSAAPRWSPGSRSRSAAAWDEAKR